jgi:hypothetical protein
LQKWELVFKIYSDILEVQSVIERATAENAFGTREEADNVPSNTEVVQSNPDTSKKEEPEVVESIKTPEEVPQPAQATEDSSVIHEDALSTQVAEKTAEQPSGNVHEAEETPVYNNTKNNESMEDKRMADTDDLNSLRNTINGAQGNVDPNQVQQAPDAKSNVTGVKDDLEEAKTAIAKELGSEKNRRDDWTKSNLVTAIVSTMAPAATRRTSDTGKFTRDTDAEKVKKAVDEKLTGFIKAVSGKTMTVEQFDANPDYSNVVPGETTENDIVVTNVDKAKAVYAELKKIAQDPMGYETKAFIPAKLSYPAKGYVLGDKDILSSQEFMRKLCDESNGAVYAIGGLENGLEVEGATSFRIATATKKEAAKENSISQQKQEIKVPVIRIKNKAKFTEGGSHVQYLFTQEAKEEQGFSSFRAEIVVNGRHVAAAFPTYVLDAKTGAKTEIPGKKHKDNTPVYKIKQIMLNVSVPVTKILKEFGAEYKGEETERVVIAKRWEISLATGKAATGRYTEIENFDQEPIFNIFTNVYAGKLTLSDELKKSATLQGIKDAAKKVAAENAADAAESLA